MKKYCLYLLVLVLLSACSSKQFAFRKTYDVQTVATQHSKRIQPTTPALPEVHAPVAQQDLSLQHHTLQEVVITAHQPAAAIVHAHQQKATPRAPAMMLKTKKAHSTARTSNVEKPSFIGSLLALLVVCILLVVLAVGFAISLPILVVLAALFLVILVVSLLVGLILG